MKLNKKYTLCAVFIFFTVIVAFNVSAAGWPWQDHARPFDFEFGNHFDTHQQSRVAGNDKLVGFFYIVFTGYDEEEDLPVAEHSDNDPDSTAGWVLDGVPVEGAILIERIPREHPIWCLDPEDIPRQPGYTHFHGFGDIASIGGSNDGYLLKLTAIDSFVFVHGDDEFVITPGIDYASHYNIEIDRNDDDCGL